MTVQSLLFKCVASMAVLAGLSARVSATTVTIGSIKDATIFENNPNFSNGAGPAIFAGNNGMNSPRRGLIEFDIAGSIPAGSTINSVQLTLFLAQMAGADTGDRTIELHRLTADWGQGVTGLGSAVGGSGQDSPPPSETPPGTSGFAGAGRRAMEQAERRGSMRLGISSPRSARARSSARRSTIRTCC
jgi:hypothetical protein